MHHTRLAALLLVLLVLPLPTLAQRPVERLFYYSDSQEGWESLRRNIDQISIVAPGRHSVDEDGIVWGDVDTCSFTARVAMVDEYRRRGFSVWVLGSEDPEIWTVLRQRGAR